MGIRKTLTVFGFGMGLMYYFDPDRGRRRRALVRDKMAHAANRCGHNLDVMIRDTSHRLEGVLAEASSLMRKEEPSALQLKERVRSKLGRHVSHPSAIDVSVAGNRVVLSGPVLADEVQNVLSAVRSTRGVEGVENRLEAHDEPGTVPGLQGARRTPGERKLPMQETWTPASRLLASSVAAGLMLRAFQSPGVLNLALGAVGCGLFTRATTNMETRRLLGRKGRRGFDIQNAALRQAQQDTSSPPFSEPIRRPKWTKIC